MTIRGCFLIIFIYNIFSLESIFLRTAGVYLLIRCSPLLEQSDLALTIIMITGAVTAFFAASVGLFQNDIKKVIAYSTMSQLAREYIIFIILRHRTIFENVIKNRIYLIDEYIFSFLTKLYYYLLNYFYSWRDIIEFSNIYLSSTEKELNEVEIISTRINKISKLEIELNNDRKIRLNPYYITGFTDGDGCFLINIRPKSDTITGYLVGLSYKIHLHWKDKVLLESIKEYFDNKGIITVRKSGHVEYVIQRQKDLNIIIDHFDKYSLITQKRSDYELFKQVYALIKNKQHLTLDGLKKIISIKAVFNKGLPDYLKVAFPDIIPVLRPEFPYLNEFNSYWVTGFVDAEGCFYVTKRNNSKGVALLFKIAQHQRDAELLKNFVRYFNCGRFYCTSGTNESYYIVTNFNDINQKIIPFFNKFPLNGVKILDFNDFKRIAELRGVKAHLKTEGLEEIKQIKSGMNKGRIFNKLERNLISFNAVSNKRTYSTLSNYTIWKMKRNYSILSINQDLKENIFNQWLAGLIDGKGQIIVSKKGYASLKIIMSVKDKSALYEIKHKYGGSIKSIAGGHSLRYKLHHKKGLLNLISGINGLIRNPARILQLNKMCVLYNIKLLEPISLSYFNGWFSGFIDAEGSIHINEKSSQLIISITQKNKYLLDQLIKLYSGRVKILSTKEAFEYSIYRKKEILDLIDNYFKYSPLKSSLRYKLSLIKDFYHYQEYINIDINQLEKFNDWIKFKNKWDKL